MERKSIGQFIAALRKANGLTQKQLADKLNVSDKAVSRWERDETAPDISLIPVIADIFGVTCDELLCGERKINNEFSSSDDEVLSAKGEKQRRRLLAIGLSQFKNKSIISVSIAAVGLIAALICNFAFYRAYLGFFIAILFYLAAAVCQIIFVNKAFLAVSYDEFEDTELQSHKRSIVHFAEYTLSAISLLIAVTLPLVISPVSSSMDAYSGIWAETWLFYGALYGIIGIVICLLVSHKINSSLANKGIVNETYNDKRRRNNFYLGFFCAVFFFVMAGITLLMWLGITEDGYAPKFAKGTVFNDYESFAEFMEKDVPDPNPDFESFYPDDPDDYIYSHIDEDTDIEELDDTDDIDDTDDNGYYDPYEGLFFSESDYGFVDSDERIVIKAANGEILLDCEKNNRSVVYIECGNESDGWLPIRVVTYDDLPEGERKVTLSGYATLAIIALEAGVAIFIYFKKREKISK